MHVYFNDSDNTVAAVEHFAAQIHCAVHAIAGYGVNVTNVNWTEHIRSDDEFEFDTFIRVSFMKVSHGETKCIWSWNGIMCASFLWSKKSTAVAVDAFTSFAHILQLVFHCMIDSVVYTFKTVAQSFNLPGRPRHPSGSIFFFFCHSLRRFWHTKILFILSARIGTADDTRCSASISCAPLYRRVFVWFGEMHKTNQMHRSGKFAINVFNAHWFLFGAAVVFVTSILQLILHNTYIVCSTSAHWLRWWQWKLCNEMFILSESEFNKLVTGQIWEIDPNIQWAPVKIHFYYYRLDWWFLKISQKWALT